MIRAERHLSQRWRETAGSSTALASLRSGRNDSVLFIATPAGMTERFLIAVPVHLVSQVADGGFVHGGGGGGEICRHVMLESVFADVVQQLLQFSNLYHAHAAESIQRVG